MDKQKPNDFLDVNIYKDSHPVKISSYDYPVKITPNNDVLPEFEFPDIDINCISRLIVDMNNMSDFSFNSWNKIIVKKIIELTRSQGGYFSYVDRPYISSVPRGVLVSTLQLNPTFGNSDNILDKSNKSVEGVCFPYIPGTFYTDCVDHRIIILANKHDKLEKHKCPGLKIYNSVHIPILNSDKTNSIALLCLANTEYQGYTPKMIKKISPLLELLRMNAINGTRNKNILEKERQIIASFSNNKLHNMAFYIVQNCKEIAAVFGESGELLVKSDVFDAEMLAISDGDSSSYKSLDDLGKHEHTREILRVIRKLFNEGSPYVVNIIHKFVTKSGTIYHNTNYGCIFEKNNSKPVGAYILSKNITKLKSYENELSELNKTLSSALREKDLYMSRISHELRTPLNSIYGYSQLIELSKDSPQEIESDWIDTIMKSSKLLLKLVDEVLDLSKINSKNIKLSLEDVKLTGAIKNCVKMLQPDIETMNITVKLNIEKNGYIVIADYHRLIQCFTNILSNAIKYNKPNGRIDIEYELMGDTIAIRFKDSGIGIDEEQLKHIGEPFNRLGMENTGISGSGLGMALTIGLLKTMNCKLKISSKKNEGTTVTIICNLSKNSSSYEISPTYLAIGNRQVTEFNDFSTNTILYIEDNPNNYKLMENIVTKYLKYDIVIAPQGRRGIDIAQSIKPIIIILDVGLPDMTGNEVLADLKSHPVTKNIPVIVYSADVTTTTISEMKDLGAVSYLTKPTDINVLVTAIKKVCNTTE